MSRDTSMRWLRRAGAQTLAALLLAGCATSTVATRTPTPTRPLGTILRMYTAHSMRVTAVAWSPDGKLVASGSMDRTVQVWDAVTGAQTVNYTGHRDGVSAVAWSPDGQYIASAALDGATRVWEARTARTLLTYQGQHGTVNAVAWSPDSALIVTGADGGTAQVWKPLSGELVTTFHGHSGPVTTVAWSPDGKRIASGGTDGTVQVWEATSGRVLVTCRAHAAKVTSLSWSPDGTAIVSGSLDRTARVWDATTGATRYVYRGYRTDIADVQPDKGIPANQIYVVAWSHNGRRIAAVTDVYCGDECGVVVDWDAPTGGNVRWFVDQPVFALAWSPDDTRFAEGAGATLAKVSWAG
jgi:WD40 repeat protein